MLAATMRVEGEAAGFRPGVVVGKGVSSSGVQDGKGAGDCCSSGKRGVVSGGGSSGNICGGSSGTYAASHTGGPCEAMSL